MQAIDLILQLLTMVTMRISKNNMPCLPLFELKNMSTTKTSVAVMSTPANNGNLGNSLSRVS